MNNLYLILTKVDEKYGNITKTHLLELICHLGKIVSEFDDGSFLFQLSDPDYEEELEDIVESLGINLERVDYD